MDDLIQFRMTSKSMLHSHKKCEKKAEVEKAKLKRAIEQKNPEGARIYAQNAIREKNQALNFLRFSSRIDAVAARLETSIRIQEVNTAMGNTVNGMANVLKNMDVDKIAGTMEDFEKAFEDMDVRAGYMEGAMEATTSSSTPADEVDKLIGMVADEAGLDAGLLLQEAGDVGTAPVPVKQAEKEKEDDLEARLAALRR